MILILLLMTVAGASALTVKADLNPKLNLQMPPGDHWPRPVGADFPLTGFAHDGSSPVNLYLTFSEAVAFTDTNWYAVFCTSPGVMPEVVVSSVDDVNFRVSFNPVPSADYIFQVYSEAVVAVADPSHSLDPSTTPRISVEYSAPANIGV
jgi:hypothetical protein